MRRALSLAAAVALLAPATASAHSLVRVGGDVVRYLVRRRHLAQHADRPHRRRADRPQRPHGRRRHRSRHCDPGAISDDADAWIVQALCPRAGVTSLQPRPRRARGQRHGRRAAARSCCSGVRARTSLRTGASADQMRGDDGNDDLATGAGNDVVDGGLGYDRLDGGDGDDLLRDADGLADRITCGPGTTASRRTRGRRRRRLRARRPHRGRPAARTCRRRHRVAARPGRRNDAAAPSAAARAPAGDVERARPPSPPRGPSTSAGSRCRCRPTASA